MRTRMIFPVLLAALGTVPAAVSAADAAGKVTYAIGEVRAYDSAGGARALAKGDAVAAGERLATGAGRLQIRLRDGGLVALQPNTEFALERFEFNEALDGNENAVFRLLRGGIRAATGLIGSKTRERYQLRTHWATIGIRGTTYKARACAGDCSVPDGLYAKGGEGVIVLFNDAGELELGLGQRGYVSAPDVEPEPTDVEPDIEDVPPPVAVASDGPVTDTGFIAGQAVFQASISGVAETLPLRVAAGAASGSIEIDDEIHEGAFTSAGRFRDSQLTVLNGSFNADGGLIGIAGVDSDGESAAVFFTNVSDVRTDGILYLGRWTEGTLTAFGGDGFSDNTELDAADSGHYVVGVTDVTLPGTGTARYDFNGMATSSTGTDGSIGRGITAGHVQVAFGINEVNSQFTVDHDGQMTISTSGLFIDGGPDFSTSGVGTGVGCESHCTVNADGFLAGQAAIPERLGLSYEIEQMQRSIVGVGGFSHTPAP